MCIYTYILIPALAGLAGGHSAVVAPAADASAFSIRSTTTHYSML